MKVMMNSTHYPSKVVVLLIALLASPSAQAFAPTTGAGQKVVGSASSLVQKRPIVAAASTTALSMNLFDRISRVTRANINNALIALEDPEKVMNQAMSDMQVRKAGRSCTVNFSEASHAQPSLLCRLT